MDISGSGKIKRLLERSVKKDISNWRPNGSKFETTDKSFYLESGEKVLVEVNTKEVKIK